MNFSGKKILITGASGFIGSHLTERLVALGAHVRAFIHYNHRGHCGWLEDSPQKKSVDMYYGEITDADSTREAIKGCDLVFHLASLISIPYSYQSPTSYFQTNLFGTLHVLQAARWNRVSRVVHTSTSEVYGTAAYIPIDENHPLQGQSPYSASKISAEKLCESYYRSFDVPIVVLRPFNTYGPRQSTRAIVPTIINQCFHSDIIKLGNITTTRDFNYVSDTVEGFLRAASTTAAVGKVFNVGTGRQISVKQLVATVAKILDKKVLLKIDTKKFRPEKSEVFRLLADNRAAKKILGWHPKTSLESGLRKTIEWFQGVGFQSRPSSYV